jgi:mono/diheme cytochrome c family protein
MRTITYAFMAALLLCCGILLNAYAADMKDPKAFFEETCSQCHSIDIPKGERMSKDDWAYTVNRMRNNGLGISDQEAAVIIEYLAATYGKK